MKYFDWDDAKNELLKAQRNVSFEEIVIAISEGCILDILEHPSARYEHQKIFAIQLRGYVYLVPFVEDAQKIFLKTIIPSRKATKIYLYP